MAEDEETARWFECFSKTLSGRGAWEEAGAAGTIAYVARPELESEIEEVGRELSAAIERDDQAEASRLFDKRVELIAQRPPVTAEQVAELKAIAASFDLKKVLAPVWAALQQAVDAGVGRADTTDWLVIECMMALLEFLEHWPFEHAVVDRQTVVKAHAMLASVSTRTVLILASQIERAVDRARRAGASEDEWVAAAKDLAARYGKPPEDLAERLRGHIVQEKQGRVPNGRYTTGMIVARLAGDENKRKLLNDACGDK